MPIITKYVCGKCKTESDNKGQYRRVAVIMFSGVDELPSQYGSSVRPYVSGNNQRNDIWCTDCTKQAGLSDAKEPETSITLEDLIREICQDEIGNQ